MRFISVPQFQTIEVASPDGDLPAELRVEITTPDSDVVVVMIYRKSSEYSRRTAIYQLFKYEQAFIKKGVSV